MQGRDGKERRREGGVDGIQLAAAGDSHSHLSLWRPLVASLEKLDSESSLAAKAVGEPLLGEWK